MDKCLTFAKLPSIFLSEANISDEKSWRLGLTNIPNIGMKYGSSRSTMDWNQTGLLLLQASLLSTQSKLEGPSFLSIGSITFLRQVLSGQPVITMYSSPLPTEAGQLTI